MFNEMMRAEIWLHETLESGKTIEELAERLGYSSSQIRRRFRQCFGFSPSGYRENLRLERAARLLAYTPYHIRDVAEGCGYTNHSAFSRAFQRRYRQSPREYRNAHRARSQQVRRPGCEATPDIRTLAPCTAVVTRCYVPPLKLEPPEAWPRALWEEAPPQGVPVDTAAIALLHDTASDCCLPKLDLGVLIDPLQACGLAMPPSLRLLALPGSRFACLPLSEVGALASTLDGLLAATLPELGEHYSGDAIRLVAEAESLQLQLPLAMPQALPEHRP